MAALIHRWPLTANANDVVGSLNLTNNGSVTFSADGASFNGSNQWLSGTKTPPSNITMTIWVTSNAFAEYAAPFLFSNNEAVNRLGFSFNSYRLICELGAGQDIRTGNTEFTSANYPPNTPVLLTVTIKSGEQKLYRGNTLLASGTFANLGTVDTNFSIGRFGAYPTLYYWNGKLADARIYDYALTSSEISALAAAGPNPSSMVRLAQVF